MPRGGHAFPPPGAGPSDASDGPGLTLDPQQARALSDALDYASRTAHVYHEATCRACGRPWPTAGLLDGRCKLCHRHTGRLRLAGTEPPTGPAYQPPKDEAPDRIARTAIRARFGDQATNVEVTHLDAALNGSPPVHLVRPRLGSNGYTTARGARKLAAYLLDAADILDAVETT